MSHDLKRIPTLSDRIKYFFKKPGWLPESVGGPRIVPEVDPSYKKYATPTSLSINLYVLFQYTLCVIVTGLFLFKASEFNMLEKISFTILIAVVIVNCAVLFENKPWVRWLEWIRIIIYPALLSAFNIINHGPVWLHVVALLYFLLSTLWFYTIQKQYDQLSVASDSAS